MIMQKLLQIHIAYCLHIPNDVNLLNRFIKVSENSGLLQKASNNGNTFPFLSALSLHTGMCYIAILLASFFATETEFQ